MMCCGSKNDVSKEQTNKNDVKHNTILAKKFYGADESTVQVNPKEY